MKELKNAGRKIKMPEDMKERIKNKCRLAESADAVKKEPHRLDGRVIAALAACLILIFVVGLKSSGRHDKKIPVAKTTVSLKEDTTATPHKTSEKITEKLTEILTTVLTTVAKSETTARVVTTTESEKTTTERNTETTRIINNEITDPIEGEEGVPPSIIEITIDKLKKLKHAAETMTEEEYSEYLFENNKEFFDVDYARIIGRKGFLEFYAKIENLYIPVFNEDEVEYSSLNCYTETEVIDYMVRLKNTQRYRFDIHFSGKLRFRYNGNEEFEFIKKIETSKATAYVYRDLVEDRWAWKGFAVELFVDGQEMDFCVGEKQTIEEFEEAFKKIDFRKIGDLVNEK